MPSRTLTAFFFTSAWRSLALIAALGVATLAAPAAGQPSGGGFVGDSRCGNPTCHGAALPADVSAAKGRKPWKSARTQWLNRNIDRHSRAFATLQTPASKRIAGYMGIEATKSEKCTGCHAPAAKAGSDSKYKQSDGVTCEHCHGAAETWIKAHVERDWPQRRAQFPDFYDNNNFRRRAEKCASCHVEIDHEIVAGGHPPLQFEMVAYAQIMKHWDDQDEEPAGAFSVDPTLWSIGQVVGLRRAAAMIAHRAGGENYQGLGNFGHFKDQNCYQCHHKLVADAVRQAHGHYEMVSIALAAVAPDQRGTLSGLWQGVTGAVPSSADAAQQKAKALEDFLSGLAGRLAGQRVSQQQTVQMLKQITASGQTLKSMRRFAFSRPPRSNVLDVDNIDIPWWYSTGPVEQTILAVQALCDPAVGAAKCTAIDPDLRAMVGAADRSNYKPDAFVGALGAISRKLF